MAAARRVAQTYRAHLQAAAPQVCTELDTRMAGYGQGWVVPRVVRWQPDDLLTPAEAADLACVEVATLRKWRQRGLLVGERAGRQWRYRAAEIQAIASRLRG